MPTVEEVFAEYKRKLDAHHEEELLKTQNLEKREQEEGIEPGHEPTEVYSHLYVGDRFSARNIDSLKSLGINYVLMLSEVKTPQAVSDRYTTEHMTYQRLPSSDEEDDNIIMLFPDILDFNNRVKQANGKGLIFCSYGVSRSTTAVLAIMLHDNKNLKDAIAQLKALHPKTFPNKGFFEQLLEEERNVFGSNSLSMDDYPAVFQ